MKIKGLRWWIIGLIMVITIINYLDRGTLNYMWVTNVEYSIVDQFSTNTKNYEAVFLKEKNSYLLKNKKGETAEVISSHLLEKKDKKVVVNREGIAYDLGIIDKNTTPDEASKKAKGILGTITIFFMIAYGISQLFSGKMYDKIGTRKGFVISAAIWGMADALTSLAKGKFSLTAF